MALPLSHLLMTSFYLWFWAVGFGANTIVLADPSDIFRVSVAELLPIYFSGFIVPGMLVLWRWTWKHPTAAHATDSIENPEVRASQAQRDNQMRFLIVASCVFIAALGTFGIWMNYQRGWAIFPVALYTLNGPAIAILYRLNAKYQLDTVPWEVLLLVVNLIIAAMTTGIAKGQTARHAEYEHLVSRRVHCGDNLILRRNADLYLAVTPDDRRVFLDLDCQVKLTVPAARAPHTARLRWTPLPWIEFIPEK